MNGNDSEGTRHVKLLRLLRALEQVRTQLDRQVQTLDDLTFIVESIHDEERPVRAGRRASREDKRTRLRTAAALRGPDELHIKNGGRNTEFRFDAGPWFTLRRSEARLLLVLAQGARGGDDGFGVHLTYDDVARALSPTMTRRALVQRIYRLRTAMLEADAANPFWIETLANVGFRLKLRNPPRLSCDVTSV